MYYARIRMQETLYSYNDTIKYISYNDKDELLLEFGSMINDFVSKSNYKLVNYGISIPYKYELHKDSGIDPWPIDIEYQDYSSGSKYNYSMVSVVRYLTEEEYVEQGLLGG